MRLKTAAKVPNIEEATMLRDFLEREGIPAFIADESFGGGGVYPGMGITQGIRIQVPEERLDEAKALVADFFKAGSSGAITEDELARLAEEAPFQDEAPREPPRD